MRHSTEIIYQQKANQVIDYISLHLHKPLTLHVLAEKVGVSQRQLIRMMHSVLNEPLAAYISRQRIERAVMYLQIEEMTLTTLANKVGYDNAQSFSKAFKKWYGISPMIYMQELRSRLEGFVESSDRNNNLYSEICEINDIELVYIRIIGKYGDEDPYEIAWNKLLCFLKQHDALSDKTRFIGISFDDPNITDPNQCRFYACASVHKMIIPTSELGTIQIKKGKYAIYTWEGSYSGLQQFYNSISVNFAHTIRHGVAFEEYLNSPRNTKEEDLRTKIYIPIK